MSYNCQAILKMIGPVDYPYCPYVTGVEKTQFPHTPYQTYDFTRDRLLAQYTIIFHYVTCSKVMSLVSVAAFHRC